MPLGRPKLINKLVSRKLSIDEPRVEKVMNFFYKELASEMEQCRYPHIYVKDLGTFTLKLKPIEARIKKLLFYIRRNNVNTDLPEGLRLHYNTGMREEILNLFRIRRMIKQTKLDYKEIKNARKIANDIEG